MFQSRSGFSGRLDLDTDSEAGAYGEFQSRSGFSGRLDDKIRPGNTVDRYVSIPFWVFWSSRLATQPTTHAAARVCFNPVLGFLVVSTGGENTAIGGKNLS